MILYCFSFLLLMRYSLSSLLISAIFDVSFAALAVFFNANTSGYVYRKVAKYVIDRTRTAIPMQSKVVAIVLTREGATDTNLNERQEEEFAHTSAFSVHLSKVFTQSQARVKDPSSPFNFKIGKKGAFYFLFANSDMMHRSSISHMREC